MINPVILSKGLMLAAQLESRVTDFVVERGSAMSAKNGETLQRLLGLTMQDNAEMVTISAKIDGCDVLFFGVYPAPVAAALGL
jgi:hypothetical protein